MKRGYALTAVSAIVSVLAIAAIACGGDSDSRGDNGDGEGSIRTQSGLTLANMDAFNQDGAPRGEESATDGDDQLVAPGAPGADADFAEDAAVPGRGSAPYPAFQQVAGGTGITVTGYGTATADADSARVELYFNKYSDAPRPEPVPDSGSSGSSDGEPPPPDADDALLQETTPISEEDVQPVIDALVGAGVDRNDIEFVGQGYYDPYYSSATLRATVTDIDSIESVTNAAREAAAGLGQIEMGSANVAYSVSDCSALESAALETAIADADENANRFAAALGVTAGEIVGAANMSYYPGEGEACDSYWGYYPVYEDIGFFGGPAEVSVYAQVSVTYAIQ